MITDKSDEIAKENALDTTALRRSGSKRHWALSGKVMILNYTSYGQHSQQVYDLITLLLRVVKSSLRALCPSPCARIMHTL